MSRSQRTPELSWIAGRSPARWTTSPGSVPPRAPGDGRAASPLGEVPSNSSSSTVTPNSDARAYSVRTDGRIFPVSICEIELGERSSRRASSRRPTPRPTRMARRRGPRSDGASAFWLLAGLGFIESGSIVRRFPRCAAPDLAVDDGADDDQQALEDVLPLLVEPEEHRR